ncbi:uncharacterized protein METZ01_LOCUS485892, partial [marine metagenome]
MGIDRHLISAVGSCPQRSCKRKADANS